MKKILVFFLLISLTGFGQTKNVISVTRVFPKISKVAEFEKALAAHAQKYHTGDWKWRVFEIQSGPDAGGFHITEGPVSWDQLDGRGDISAAHIDDWNKNVTPFLTEKFESSYSVFREELSTVQLTDYSDKIQILHFYTKVGMGSKFEDLVKQLKKAWEAGNQSVAVYEASGSGDPQLSFVIRYKQGLKERNTGFRPSMKERFDKELGAGSWDTYLENSNKYVDRTWSELLFFRKELSSPQTP